VAASVLLAVCGLPWYVVNLTPSAPRGIWRRLTLPAEIERGMWVILPVPASVEPWLTSFTPLLKPVAAIEGDRVCVTDETLWIRGTPYGQVYTEAHGKPLPHLDEGCFTVQKDTVFLASKAFHSVDSRYFGSVPVAVLTARALPLWTWR
jgi:conjugative transfer signal peptidase TraF